MRKHLVNRKVPKKKPHNYHFSLPCPLSLTLPNHWKDQERGGLVPVHQGAAVPRAPAFLKQRSFFWNPCSTGYELLCDLERMNPLTSLSIFWKLKTMRLTSEEPVVRLKQESMCVCPEQHLVEVQSVLITSPANRPPLLGLSMRQP